MKSNDEIPADEMLLAEAIAAVKDLDLGWTRGTLFKNAGNRTTFHVDEATRCCALGGLIVAGRLDCDANRGLAGWDDTIDGKSYARISTGNDSARRWSERPDDSGESLGWAFRCAMTESP